MAHPAKRSEGLPRFWQWFFLGTPQLAHDDQKPDNNRPRSRAGWRKFADRWLALHVFVGVIAAVGLPVPLAEAAKAVLMPLAGVLVGMTFAWVGSAQAIMQTAEIDRLADEQGGGAENYVFTFQSAILAILATMIAWSIAGLGIFDLKCPWACPGWLYRLTVGFLFFLASVTVRECWQVVIGAQMLLLAQRRLARIEPENRDPKPRDQPTDH